MNKPRPKHTLETLADTTASGALRPASFDDFTGNRRVVKNLQVFVTAAHQRGEALDHVLLHGPPGLGKTTLAIIIAREMGVGIQITSAPTLDKPATLAGLLLNLNAGDVLFIDEIHRLPPAIEEYLYSAMEDYAIDIVIDNGPSSRAMRLELSPFTLVGATTRAGRLTAPLRARFGISLRLDFYAPEELLAIIRRAADQLQMKIAPEAARMLAMRSRGTPRIALSLLRRLRDFAQVNKQDVVDEKLVNKALEALGIDRHGLDEMDHRILRTLVRMFHGGPVGLQTLAVALGEDPATIEDVYEPYLIRQGFIKRTLRGRMALPPAYRLVGEMPPPSLFESEQ